MHKASNKLKSRLSCGEKGLQSHRQLLTWRRTGFMKTRTDAHEDGVLKSVSLPCVPKGCPVRNRMKNGATLDNVPVSRKKRRRTQHGPITCPAYFHRRGGAKQKKIPEHVCQGSIFITVIFILQQYYWRGCSFLRDDSWQVYHQSGQ